jgi:hypothetical protein
MSKFHERNNRLRALLEDRHFHFLGETPEAGKKILAIIGSFPVGNLSVVPQWMADARCVLRQQGYVDEIICPIRRPGTTNATEAYWESDLLNLANIVIFWFDNASLLCHKNALFMLGQALQRGSTYTHFVGWDSEDLLTPTIKARLKEGSVTGLTSLELVCQIAAGQRSPTDL